MIRWIKSEGLVSYPEALDDMQRRVDGILSGTGEELVWLLQHPPLYTAGTSANQRDLIAPSRFPVFDAGRGGQYTYHGPGQRVAYVMLDLRKRGQDLRSYIFALEEWIIRTLAELGVQGERRKDRVGVWVRDPQGGENKIAAIGVRVRRWVTFHGISINVDPELEHYSGIVPCGISDFGVTSLAQLDNPASLRDVDIALRKTFDDTVGALAPEQDHRASQRIRPSA